jgi:hypothetical protein
MMIRNLTYLERVLWRALQGRPLNFSLVARLGGTFAREGLQHAYDLVRRRHPTLGTRVEVMPGGVAYLAAHAEIKLRIMPRQRDDDWIRIAQEELIVPFDWEHDPPLRMVWVRGQEVSELVTIWNHGLADGLSAAYVLRELLEHLGLPNEEVVPMATSPGIEDLVPAAILGRPSLRIRARLVAALIRILQAIQRQPCIVQGVSDQNDLVILPRLFSETETRALLARCRTEQTTLLGALCAAFLLAWAEYSPPELAKWRSRPLATANKGKRLWRRASCPVSLRGVLEPPVGEAFGQFLTNLAVTVDCSPEHGFWEIARAARQELTRLATPERLLRGPLLLRTLREMAASDRLIGPTASRDGRVNYDLSISNLGNLTFPTGFGGLRLEAIFGPATNALRGEQILGANALTGRLTLTLSTHEAVLDRAVALRILDDAIARLGKAVGRLD